MTTTTARPLVELPKAHLHVHLEGAMRPSTLDELCRAQGNRISEQCQEAGEICFVPSGPLEFAA